MLKNVLPKDLNINDNVSMTLYGAVGGATEIVGKLLATVSAEGLPPNANAYTNHTNIYSQLPDTIKAIYEDDFTRYNYLMVKGVNETIYYIGIPWIVESALYVNSVATATLVISDFRDEDTAAIKFLLSQNGYTVSSISVSE